MIVKKEFYKFFEKGANYIWIKHLYDAGKNFIDHDPEMKEEAKETFVELDKEIFALIKDLKDKGFKFGDVVAEAGRISKEGGEEYKFEKDPYIVKVQGMWDKNQCTLSGLPAENPVPGAPAPINPETGMHKDYYVLSQEEIDKGFTRSLRFSYKHVGIRPKYPLRDLTEDEKKRHKGFGYVKYEDYPEKDGIVGKYWTDKGLESGCGTITTMGAKIAETYARDPKFYGSTFCCACKTHFPVGEFVWDGDEEVVGS